MTIDCLEQIKRKIALIKFQVEYWNLLPRKLDFIYMGFFFALHFILYQKIFRRIFYKYIHVNNVAAVESEECTNM